MGSRRRETGMSLLPEGRTPHWIILMPCRNETADVRHIMFKVSISFMCASDSIKVYIYN